MKLIYFELVLCIYANIIVFPAAAENHIAASSRTEPVVDKYYVDDGCHIEQGGVADDYAGQFLPKTFLAGVRCCEPTETLDFTCITIGDCWNKKDNATLNNVDFDSATIQCEAVNRTLCTKDQLLSNGCCETKVKQGGMCNNYPVWTSTPEPVNGAWSAWGTWGNCSEVCGPGIKERTRVCNDPPPQFEGADCPVDEPNTETETCNEKPCPINCEWYDWVSGVCSKTCGEGLITSQRTKKVEEDHGGICTGTATKTKKCKIKECPVHCDWNDWEYGDCSVACGGGVRTDTRTVNTTAEHGGNKCEGESTALDVTCNEDPCPINGGWSGYTYGRCSATCGEGRKTGTRKCTNPAPAHGGKGCTGSPTAYLSCNSNTCPDKCKCDEIGGDNLKNDIECRADKSNYYSHYIWCQYDQRCTGTGVVDKPSSHSSLRSQLCTTSYVKVRGNSECKSDDTWLGEFNTVPECAKACRNRSGCKYFIYGHCNRWQDKCKHGKCYVEHTSSRYCSQGWDSDNFDFYELRG